MIRVVADFKDFLQLPPIVSCCLRGRQCGNAAVITRPTSTPGPLGLHNGSRSQGAPSPQTSSRVLDGEHAAATMPIAQTRRGRTTLQGSPFTILVIHNTEEGGKYVHICVVESQARIAARNLFPCPFLRWSLTQFGCK